MMLVYGIRRTTLDDAAWRRSEKHLTLKLALVKKNEVIDGVMPPLGKPSAIQESRIATHPNECRTRI